MRQLFLAGFGLLLAPAIVFRPAAPELLAADPPAAKKGGGAGPADG
jgi:hypothetical protein